MKNGLEVFDFKEEKELAEITPRKVLANLKNPNDVVLEHTSTTTTSANSLNPVLLKYGFLQHDSSPPLAQGSDIPHKEVGSLPCVDIDRVDSDPTCGTPIMCTPLVLDKKVFDAKDKDLDQDGPLPLMPPSQGRCPDDKNEKCEAGTAITEREFRASASCLEAPSPVKSNSMSSRSDSPCRSDSVDVEPNTNERMDEESPSSPAPNEAKGGVLLNVHASSTCLGVSEMDDIIVAVDYVVYRDSYFTGCLVSFSSSGIKIYDSAANDHEQNFRFERSIDYIIKIESQHLGQFGTILIKLQVISEDVEQEDNACGTSGIEELALAVADPDFSGKWEEMTTRNVKYSALWSAAHDMDICMNERSDLLRRKPYFPIFDEAFEDVIYPKGESDAVSISKRDVDLLQPETFINDTIIDFYVKYLRTQIPQDEKRRFHFFNSFFFRKLADLDKDPSSASNGRAAFLRVHKWTRKVDLFGKDYIFIPVNFNLHWSLLVLCHLGEVPSFNDEDLGRSPRVPCILHMDSIKGTHAGLKNLVQSYLWEEWKERHKGTPEDMSTKFLNLRFVPLELPQQENSFDCGLFLLHYLELFLIDAPVDFSPFIVNEYSKFLTMDWFPPVEASLKRTLIQRLIFELLENHSLEVSSDDCGDEMQANCSHEDKKAGGVEFVSEQFIPAVTCHTSFASSEPGQGIEITLLEASSARNSHCMNDPGLVLKDLFEPGVAAGSLLAHCSSFGRASSYSVHNGNISQMEDDEEAGDQLAYFQSGQVAFQQNAGVDPRVSGAPFSFSGLEADGTWILRTSVQEEDDELSSEASVCASDDLEVGVIDKCPVQDMTPQLHQHESRSMENLECPTESLTSASREMLEMVAVGFTEDPDKMHYSYNTHDLATCPEKIPPLHALPNSEENVLDRDVERVGVSQNDTQINENNVMVEQDDAESAERLYERDEPQAAKRPRLTLPLEVEEGGGGSLPEDLHL